MPDQKPPSATATHFELFNELSLRPEILRGQFVEFARVVTQTLAESLRVGRINVWTFNADRSAIVSVDEFDLKSGKHHSGTAFPIAAAPKYFAKLCATRSLSISDSMTDPIAAEFREVYSRPLGIGALLDSLIFYGQEMVGVMCFENVGGPHVWTVEETYLAGIVADLLSRAYTLQEQQKLMVLLETQNEDLEKRIKVRTLDLEDLVSNQTALLRGICHDIANAINMIYVNCEIGKRKPEAKFFDQVRQSAALIQGMMSDVRCYCKFSDQHTGSGPKTGGFSTTAGTDLTDLALQARLVMNDRARQKGIQIQTQFETLKEVWVEADPFALLHSVVCNLLNNAIKFSPENGKIEVYGRDQGDHFELVIRDYGHGMSSEKIHEITDAHGSVKSELGTKGEAGTGYGLLQVKHYLRRFDGSFTVRSWTRDSVEAPRGTEITLRLRRYSQVHKKAS